MKLRTLELEKRSNGVAVLCLDAMDSPVNLISKEFLNDLSFALDEIQRDPKIKACVLTSSKNGVFLAGADIDGLSHVTSAKEAEKLSKRAQDVFDRIARGPVPFVAAINGQALGGGLEIALACHARVAADNPQAVLALPEVQLGLLPGAGGTQRLPKLVGLPAALPLLLTGSRVRAKKALGMGLIDKLVPSQSLTSEAEAKALSLAAKKGWREPRNPKIKPLMRAMSLPVARSIVLNQARKQALKKTRGHYPAPVAILSAVEAGLNGGSRGYAREARKFGELVASRVAKNLIWIFTASRELKKPRASESSAPSNAVKKLAVIGAGLMGEGIASVSLPLSQVALKDVSEKTLNRAKENILSSLDKRLLSGSLTQPDRDRQLEHLTCSLESRALAGADLVIEAVFEELSLKRKILAEVESIVSSDAVFASNTSALPISQIAAEAKHPERVLGMHYFSPVPKMPLLEIIVTPKTTEKALNTARAYGIKQGKTVIVVKDQPGFYTTRILAPLLNETMLLIEDGAAIDAIDSAMKKFGFPVGPVVLIDEVGHDVAMHVGHDLGLVYGKRWGRTPDAMAKMTAAGYLGKKNKKGFYDAKKQPNADVYQYFGGGARKEMEAKEISARISLMMVNEAVYCLEEGVLECARDGDIGAIMGLGFPPFLGGPFHYIDHFGVAKMVALMHDMETQFGPRFKPAPLLERMASKGERFYP